MSIDLPLPELPEELAAKIHEIALKKGVADEEIIADLLRTFMEMVDNPRKESDISLTKRIRLELHQKYGIGPEES
jgi:hypothetical protein